MNPPDRHRQKKHWVQSRQTSTGPSRQTLAEKKRWEPVQTDTDQTHQTDTGKKRYWVGPDRHQVIPSDRLATNVGKHFGQTSIELIRQTLAKETLGFSPDRHQQVPPDRHWQKRNGEN